MCFELNSTIKASNANLHIFKQIGAPPKSQNSWGAKSANVSTKDTRDAYDKNIHFISKEKEIWFGQGLPVRPVRPGRH